ncbi:hypothetical protein ACIGW7_16585 [Streptomyces sp. NPDC053253]
MARREAAARISGVAALMGATISAPQLLDLAPALVQHIGLTVKDA